MLAPLHPNKKPAEATTPSGFDFVLTTPRSNSGKDNRYVLLHDHGAAVHP